MDTLYFSHRCQLFTISVSPPSAICVSLFVSYTIFSLDICVSQEYNNTKRVLNQSGKNKSVWDFFVGIFHESEE